MSNPGPSERRLAAIVFTDVVGYSARVQRDETGALTLVKADFDRIRVHCAQHGGEVLKSTGDGLLLCFASVVQAVACALQIQAEFAGRPADALQHRIGIHLGDVFREGGDVVGDGVNIAARLQTKARPGTICLSQSVYDAVKGKLPLQAEPLGPQQFKNIAQAIPVWLATPAGSAVSVPSRGIFRGWWLAGEVLLAAVLVGYAGWMILSPKPALPGAGPAAAPAPATGPTMSDKSIAVLPFTNMSDDKDSGYFADGVHEDILTNLANIAALKVISRTSVMQFRGSTKTIRQIAAELGVAYVLEGSVRHAGNKIRVTGQLINARTDEHVWAKTYDRDLTDVFAVQTDLSREIATALQAVLSPQEKARLEKQPTQSMAAYELYQQAMALSRQGVVQVTIEQALPLLERAVELDPGYAMAWTEIYWIERGAYWRESRPAGRLVRMRKALARAEAADPDDSGVLKAGIALGEILADRAMVGHYQQKIIELYPNRPEAYQALGRNAADEGRWEDALMAYEKARSLDPLNTLMLESLDNFLLNVRRYAEAEETERAIVQLEPGDYDAALRLACAPFFRAGLTRELKALLARLPEDRERSDPAVRNTRFEAMLMLGDANGMIRLWRESGGNIEFRNYTKRQARMLIAAALLERNDIASARPLLEQNRDEARVQLAGEPTMLEAMNDLGVALAMLGDQDAGRAELAKARKILDGLPPVQFKTKIERFYNTTFRAWAGEKEESIRGLNEMLQSPQMGVLKMNVFEIRCALLMLPLRGHPAFEAMLNDPRNNAPLF